LIKREKISDFKLKKIILHFCVDIEASKAAIVTGINRNTINAYYHHFRSIIAGNQVQLMGSLKLPASDNLVVGSFEDLLAQIKSKVIRKQMSGYPVYGLFEQGGQVFCEIIYNKAIADIDGDQLVEGKAEMPYSKGFQRNYQAILFGKFPRLISIEKFVQTQKKSSSKEFTIQSFWSFSKRRMGKFNGISKHFYYHLKECEWRWKKKENEMTAQLYNLVKKKST